MVIKIFGSEYGQKWAWPIWWLDLKLTVSEEWANGISWFFACWYVITKKIKTDQKFFRWVWTKIVWPVWAWESKISRLNKVIFSCWLELRKAKSWFSYFWVGIVKNGNGFLVQERPYNLLHRKNYFFLIELIFLNADNGALIFGKTDI